MFVGTYIGIVVLELVVKVSSGYLSFSKILVCRGGKDLITS